MPSVDEILASPPLSGLRRVTRRGGNRQVVTVRLAEQFSDLNPAPAQSMVILSRTASAAATDYRLDMALRWAAVHNVAAVGCFADGVWQPPMTAVDIADRADIALVSVPPAAAPSARWPGPSRAWPPCCTPPRSAPTLKGCARR